MTETTTNSKKTRWPIVLLALLVLGVLAFGGYAWWSTRQAAEQAAQASSTYQTATVRRGDLTLSISGSGTVVSDQSLDLDFTLGGTLAEVDVQVGEQVQAGQVLARLKETDQLALAVQTQELAVLKAQKTVADLQSGGALVAAQAQADLANAQENLVSAQENLLHDGQGRCSAEKSRELYFIYVAAQTALTPWEDAANDPHTGYGIQYLTEKLTSARQARDQAKMNLDWCAVYTPEEVQQSQANFTLAQAQVALYTEQAANANANQGVDPQELAIAQAALSSAQAGLAKAQADQAAATLTAPFAGTVMAVNGETGDTVSGSAAKASSGNTPSTTNGSTTATSTTATSTALVTLADLQHPQVQVNIDETDLVNFAVGCEAQISFDSLPDQTFSGVVSAVSPSLVTVQSVGMVQGLIELQNSTSAAGKPLPPGMVASVEITCRQAKNALLVPLQALHEGPGEPAFVMVLNSQGQPEKRAVAVSLKTVASAAITSGLQEGEKVVLP